MNTTYFKIRMNFNMANEYSSKQKQEDIIEKSIQHDTKYYNYSKKEL